MKIKDFRGAQKVIAAAIATVLLIVAADNQAMARGKRGNQPAENTETAAKKKKADEDYKNALKKIPESTEKQDPWKTLR
jgi:hypothetical protein